MPSRATTHSSSVNSTIVDASDTPVSPASSTSGNRPPSCFMTCWALAHAGNPEIFALVPVKGPSNSSINFVTTSLFGQRTASRPVFAVTFNGKRFEALTTIVSAPGQNASASLIKFRGTSRASIIACSIEPTRIGKARASGRPFTRKISSTAARLNGSAARP